MSSRRASTTNACPSPRWRVLGLLVGVAAGCVQSPVVREHPELIARVTRTDGPSATPAAEESEKKSSADPSVKPTSEERLREPDPTAAMSVPPELLTLEQARDLAMRYSPVLAQSRASVDAARANVEITDSAFHPTIQGNQAFQAFNSQTGFSGTPIGGRFPILPVRGFGPGTQDFNVADAELRRTNLGYPPPGFETAHL